MNVTELLAKIRRTNRVFLIGNGGSWANAIHVCNDLISVGVPSFTLDPATLTALANDFSYEEVFSRWLRVVATKSDLLIAFSGSGTSPNIIKALETAQSIGMDSYLVTHYLKGKTMQESEEEQIVIGHQLREALIGQHQGL